MATLPFSPEERKRKIEEEFRSLAEKYGVKPAEYQYVTYAVLTNKATELVPLGWFTREQRFLAYKYREEGRKRLAEELEAKRRKLKEQIKGLLRKISETKEPGERERLRLRLDELKRKLEAMPKYVKARVLTYKKLMELGAPELRKPQLAFAPEERIETYLATPEETRKMEEEWRREVERRKATLDRFIATVLIPTAISAGVSLLTGKRSLRSLGEILLHEGQA